MMRPCPLRDTRFCNSSQGSVIVCQSLLSAVVMALFRILTKMTWAHPTLGWAHLGWALVGEWSQASIPVFPGLPQEPHKGLLQESVVP